MPEYILVARRPIRRGVLIRGVKEALIIPSGMQDLGAEFPAKQVALAHNLVKKLMAQGIPEARARQIVQNALHKWKRGIGWKRRGFTRPPGHSKPGSTRRAFPSRGMGQFHNRAAGYMQVEPAYERPVYGLGDFRQAVLGLIAEKELNQLTSALHRLNEQVVQGIDDRNETARGYKEAKALLDEAVKQFGPPMISGPMGVSIPNPSVLPAYMAMATARKGVQVLARQVQMLGMLDRVFTKISVELTNAGATNDANSIDITLAQLRRFILDTDKMIAPLAPEYMDTKRAILQSAERKYAAAGIATNAIDDPKWFGLYVEAANEIVPLPDQPSPPPGAGLGMPAIAAVIIWIVAVVAAAVVASQAIARLIPDQNSKAITARQIALEAAERKRQVEMQMRAQGASQAEIDAAKKSIDADTKDSIENIPEPKSPFGALAIPIAIVAALGIGKAAGVL